MENLVNFPEQVEENDVQTVPEETDEPEEIDEPQEPDNLEETDSPDESETAEETDGTESAEEAAERPVIFISHRQGFELDQGIASMLYDELSSDCEVYLDTERPGAERYGESIQASIKDSHFVIALMTGNANRSDSDWMMYELGYAHQCWKQFGHPELLPVHLEPIETYEARIGACLSGFNRIDYDGDTPKLVARIRAAIVRGIPPRERAVSGMEGFRVKDSLRDRMRAALLESPKLKEASARLGNDRLLWITGDAGVRNYIALSLAVKEQLPQAGAEAEAASLRKIYEVKRALSWSKVNNTLIRDSIIIFRDVVPAALFDEEKNTDELDGLDSLIQRGNTVIVTASADSYLEIQQEMRKQDFEGGGSMEVNHEFYNDSEKQLIFEKLLDFSKETGGISPKQYEWAHGLLDKSAAQKAGGHPGGEGREIFRSIIGKWSPADVERFITFHLRQVKRSNDILRLLRRNADLDNEIHSWFVSLDESTRCFVMALALFSGLNQEQLWEKYKAIVESLHRLDAGLSLWPLGICRQRARLYVTPEGAIDFEDERIAGAICREIAKSYREYFIELTPLMREWSVPPGRSQRRANAISDERKRRAAEDWEVRAAVARMVGKVGRHGFADLSGLIDYWATDPIFKVREAVALSLEQATCESMGAKQTFNILDKWCGDHSGSEDALCRAKAAASALGSIAAANANTGSLVYVKALNRLKKLARDARRDIRFFVSIPLKKTARKVPLSEIKTLLGLVIQDQRPATRINVADALNEARVFDEAAVLELLDEWLASEDASRRWAAMCSIILWRKQSDEERTQEVIRFLDRDPATVAGVFVEAVKQKYHRARMAAWFEQLASEMPDDARRRLISGLAEQDFSQLDERLLARLRASGNPQLAGLAVEVRGERWRRLLSTPNDLLNDLRRELHQGRMTVEVYTGLTLLLRPEPEGCRQRLVEALAACFVQNRVELDQVLNKLKDIAPTTFEPLSVEVRREILKRLFYDPNAFVEVAAAYMRRAETAEEARNALEALAQPEGYREELLQALAFGYALDAASVKRLLGLFRGAAKRTLRLVVYEFNLRLLEGQLSNPAGLVAEVLGAAGDEGEWEEMIQVLRYLAASGAQSKRKLLVRALAEARATQSQEVDGLLQHPSIQAQPELAGLRSEVRLASALNSVFVPKLLARLFTSAR